MDKAFAILESLKTSFPQLPIGYQRLSLDTPSIDKEIDLDSSLVHPPSSKPGYAKPIPDQPLVGKTVDLGSPPVDHFVSEEHHAHVIIVSSDSPEFDNEPPIPTDYESPSLIPLKHGGNHTILPPSSLVIIFDWSHLNSFHLPSYVPFEITVHAYNKAVPGAILDECASISIMPSTTWKALGSPQLVPVMQNLLAFDEEACQLVWILPNFPVTLGGKTIYIDVMVVQGVNFSLLLGHDYVYAMGALISSLFHVARFSNDGRMVTIDQLSFFSPPLPPAEPSPPIGSCSKAVPSLP